MTVGYSPFYSILSHFSKFIRPGAVRIGFEISNKEVITTVAKNPDGTIVLVLLNQQEASAGIDVKLDGNKTSFELQGKAIQTVVLPSNE
jgi:glucosylceramidase